MWNGPGELVHQNGCPTSTEILVIGIEGGLARWSEILRHRKAAGELEERVAIVIGRTRRVRRVEGRVSRGEIQIVARICRRRSSAHPDAAVMNVWGDVQHPPFRQVSPLVPPYPPLLP